MFHQKMNDLINNFNLFENWEEKYSYIIELGQKLPKFDDHKKQDRFKVVGCTSNVWMILLEEKNNKIIIEADSDAHIVKGLVYILLEVYSNQTKEDIQKIDIEVFMKELGLKKFLSPSRANGLNAMINRIKLLS